MPVSDGMEFIHILGKQAYQCGIVIVSEIDKHVISLASDLARKGMTHLIGNLPKPIFIENLSAIMGKLHLFLQKGVQPNLEPTEEELLNAITENQIRLFTNSKLIVRPNRVSSIEILARIVRPQDLHPIAPSALIPVAQKYDLINLPTFQLFEKSSE